MIGGGRCCHWPAGRRAAGLPRRLLLVFVLLRPPRLGCMRWAQALCRLLVGAAFAVLPGFYASLVLLVGGHAVSVKRSAAPSARPGRWHHQVLCLLLSALGIVLV